MPPLIAFAGALGGLAVVRWAYRTAVRINQELEEARLARRRRGRQIGRNPDPAARSRHRRLSAGLKIDACILRKVLAAPERFGAPLP